MTKIQGIIDTFFADPLNKVINERAALEKAATINFADAVGIQFELATPKTPSERTLTIKIKAVAGYQLHENAITEYQVTWVKLTEVTNNDIQKIQSIINRFFADPTNKVATEQVALEKAATIDFTDAVGIEFEVAVSKVLADKTITIKIKAATGFQLPVGTITDYEAMWVMA